MEGVRRQAHDLAMPQRRLARHPDPPPPIKCAGRAPVRGVEFDAQIDRLPVGHPSHGAQVNLPLMHVSRRDNLVLGFDLFQDLPPNLGNIGLEARVLLQAFPEQPVRLRLDFLVEGRRLGRTARHEHLVAQNLLLVGWQPRGTPLQQAIHTAAGQRQQDGIQRHDPQPFAQPDLPAGDRLDGNHLQGAILDVSRQSAARQPKRGKPEQGGDGAQRVGQHDLDEAARRAVILDQERQADHRPKQQDRHDQEEPEPKGGFPGQPGDGKQRLHESTALRAR